MVSEGQSASVAERRSLGSPGAQQPNRRAAVCCTERVKNKKKTRRVGGRQRQKAVQVAGTRTGGGRRGYREGLPVLRTVDRSAPGSRRNRRSQLFQSSYTKDHSNHLCRHPCRTGTLLHPGRVPLVIRIQWPAL